MAEAAEFLSPEWLAGVRDRLNVWPDDAERADARKPESYWEYVARKAKTFDGMFALGIRDTPGRPGETVFVGVTYADGVCAAVDVVPAERARAEARIALEVLYSDWLDIVDGYDIGKAMTYHKLPQVAGDALTLLRNVYFLHEILTVLSREPARYPQPAVA